MGEMADLAWEEGMMEAFSLEDHVDTCMDIPAQKIIDDLIHSFKEQPVDEFLDNEVLARSILHTIARLGQVTDRQKKCLVRVLVYRGEEGYEM